MVYGHDASAALEHEIHRGVGGLLVHLARDLRERLAVVLAVLRIARVREHNAIPATCGLDHVPPAGNTTELLALESRADFRVRETRAQRVASTLHRPAWNRRFESRAARGVDVHVGGDVHSSRARSVDHRAN